jgi:hypothetical protein
MAGNSQRTDWRFRFASALGAAVGLALAVWGALAPVGSARLSPGAMARVNRVEISLEAFRFAAARLASGRHAALTERDRRWVVDQLINEELLVQRGVEVGLLESDTMVRKAIANAVLDRVFADAAAVTPSEGKLRAFYEAYKARFARPARIRVQQIYFSGANAAARDRAKQAYDALAHGMPFGIAQQRYADPNSDPIPDAMIPLHELRDRAGPKLTNAALALNPGAISRPIESSSGYHILYVADFEPERIPSYETIRSQVEDEFRRRAPDDALQELLDGLRRNANIALAPDAPR